MYISNSPVVTDINTVRRQLESYTYEKAGKIVLRAERNTKLNPANMSQMLPSFTIDPLWFHKLTIKTR